MFAARSRLAMKAVRTVVATAMCLALAVPPLAQPPNPAASAPAVRFVDALPQYAPADKVSGTITLWGHGSFKHDFMGPLVNRWIVAFHNLQPDVQFVYKMYGTASAIGALYTGAGNLAILGEEISPEAALAFRRAKGYAPTGIPIATGSLDVNFFDYAHMIFVHRDNPIETAQPAKPRSVDLLRQLRTLR